MPRIVPDRSGDVRQHCFYRFSVQLMDDPPEAVGKNSVVVRREPTRDQLLLQGKETYAWIEITSRLEDLVEIKDCPADNEHVTHHFYKKSRGERMGDTRISPFVPANLGETIVLSDELHGRLRPLGLSGAQVDELELVDHYTDAKVRGFWSLQFVGKAKLRLPKFIDAANRCPHCGRTKILCESCGQWTPYCTACKNYMVVIESGHKGNDDKRIPFEDGIDPVDGKSWDGSDLIQSRRGNLASKRFIDWLLRIHAAPFYAEPVDFCVDGMNDQQKKWFDDLQKPLEA